MALDTKKKQPVWEPPPLDWRKFDDPCAPRTRAKKIKNRLGTRRDLADELTFIQSDGPRLAIIATEPIPGIERTFPR